MPISAADSGFVADRSDEHFVIRGIDDYAIVLIPAPSAVVVERDQTAGDEILFRAAFVFRNFGGQCWHCTKSVSNGDGKFCGQRVHRCRLIAFPKSVNYISNQLLRILFPPDRGINSVPANLAATGMRPP